MKNNIEIGVYYFPNYHKDARNAAWHGKDWTEWELVKLAKPRFPGHQQPKVPLWGYEDEADPAVMGKKIDAAADAGITSFIFDWYWYNDGPYLQNCLEKGFLGAPNTEKLKFALMWANHDWVDIHPAQRSVHSHGVNTLAAGTISEEAFVRATDHMIQTYFCRPNYWRIDGGLYVSFYMIAGLIRSFGGAENVQRALEDFRNRVRAAGLGELHLNAVVWEREILPGEEGAGDVNALLKTMGFDSITSYVWMHNQTMEHFPFEDYAEYAKRNACDYSKFTEQYELPYFPNVSMGWDSSPRTCMSDRYDNIGYPFCPILQNNTPEEFGKALARVKEFLATSSLKQKMFTINAWNEWTEGSYLEPDMIHGYGYLNAIKKTFKEGTLNEI